MSHSNSRHTSSIISTVLDVTPVNTCFWACQQDWNCVGINVISISGIPPTTCQLLSEVDDYSIVDSPNDAVYRIGGWNVMP